MPEKQLKPFVLPSELNLQYNSISTVIIDTDSQDSSPNLQREISEASVIILVYDINRDQTISCLAEKWLPIVASINRTVPVVLVGNKKDRDEDLDPQNRVQAVIRSFIRKWPQVEMGLQCSVLKNEHVLSVLYCAQKAVIYPMGVLYDLNKNVLTLAFRRALARIFRIADADADGFLSDSELVAFNEQVFKGTLGGDDIRSIKDIIRDELRLQAVDKISLEGFCALQKRCIEQLKIQTCWTVLRHFGYDDQLNLREDHMIDDLTPPTQGESVQLTHDALRFLTREFSRFANSSGYLPVEQLEQVFFAIDSEPFQTPIRLVPTVKYQQSESLRVSDWLKLWHHQTFQNYKHVFKIMCYLGFQGGSSEVFRRTNRKSTLSGLRLTGKRNVLSVAILSASGCDMSPLFNSYCPSGSGPRRQLILEKMNSQGNKLFILKDVPEEGWQNFMESSGRQYDIIVFCLASLEQANRYCQLIKRIACCRAICTIQEIQPQRFNDISTFSFKTQTFLNFAFQILSTPQEALGTQNFIRLQKQEQSSGSLGKYLFLGSLVAVPILYLGRKWLRHD